MIIKELYLGLPSVGCFSPLQGSPRPSVHQMYCDPLLHREAAMLATASLWVSHWPHWIGSCLPFFCQPASLLCLNWLLLLTSVINSWLQQRARLKHMYLNCIPPQASSLRSVMFSYHLPWRTTSICSWTCSELLLLQAAPSAWLQQMQSVAKSQEQGARSGETHTPTASRTPRPTHSTGTGFLHHWPADLSSSPNLELDTFSLQMQKDESLLRGLIVA